MLSGAQMRIAWFTDTYLPQTNGVAIYIADALRLLSKTHEVVLFAPGEGGFRTEEEGPNFRIIRIPSSPFPFYEGYRVASADYRRISALLRKERPDIVHAHAPINLGIQGIIAAKRAKIPCAATYHTHFPDYVPHLLNGRLPKFLHPVGDATAKEFVKRFYGMADLVAAPTEELAAELRSYGLGGAICLHNGIDFSKLECTDRDAAAFRKAHGIGAGRRAVLYLGRLSFEKRVDRLMEAFAMVDDPEAVLVLAGGGPRLDEFKRHAGSMGLKNVVFTGFIRETGPAYRACDIFASASDSETFGLTFVEAMHAGLPVVGVRRLGTKEVVSDGKSGILVDPGDAKALSAALGRLLGDPALRERMGAEGRKESERYSIERNIEATLALYGRLRGGGGRACSS